MKKFLNRLAVLIVPAVTVMVAELPARGVGNIYTWAGADGGSWGVASNWDDGSGHSTGSPGSTDFAQFQGFSGKVTGGVGANILGIGPNSSLILGGSGFFSQITVGQDLAANTGAASLEISAGNVISATLLDLDSALGGSGTLKVGGTFSTTGGIVTDQTGLTDSIIVQNGGLVEESVSLTMAAGGLIQVGNSGQMIIGSASGGGTNGALSILTGYFFDGEGTIAGNVVVNGTLQTFNAGWSANVLTITGNVSGTGNVQVVQELDVDGAVSSGVTFSLFANGGSNKGLLRIVDGADFQGIIGTVSTGSIIDLEGLSFDHIVWSPNGLGAVSTGDAEALTSVGGTLTLTGSSGTMRLATSGDYSSVSFSVQPDAISGTDILVGVAAVPEPASGTMLVGGVLFMSARRWLRLRILRCGFSWSVCDS